MAAENDARGKSAVLLIAHGSRREAANQDLVALAATLVDRGLYPIIEIAYLELRSPRFLKGASHASAGGRGTSSCSRTFSPPALTSPTTSRWQQELSAQSPDVHFILCKPLSLHPLLVDIVVDRLHEAEKASCA